jgi:hypothetical protein
MAFTVNDLQDLIALLAEKPEWRAQLRPLILGDEFERIPQILAELAEAQRRTEARVEELAIRVDQLSAKIDLLTDSVQALVERARVTDTRLDAWDGFWSRELFETYARDYFGDLVRRARVISVEEAGADDAFDAGKISEAELRQLDNLDIVVRGRSKADPSTEITLAIEISKTIDYNDVDRAAERAGIFNKAGIPAQPAVGGARIDDRVRKFADERGVFVKLVAASEMPA